MNIGTKETELIRQKTREANREAKTRILKELNTKLNVCRLQVLLPILLISNNKNYVGCA
jgi:hypothetical protein